MRGGALCDEGERAFEDGEARGPAVGEFEGCPEVRVGDAARRLRRERHVARQGVGRDGVLDAHRHRVARQSFRVHQSQFIQIVPEARP